jgi:RimJ/RimL family protein N-acetyltransferase
MNLRRATMEDALAVLEWRNDPQTCAASKSGAVSLADHLTWFATAKDRIWIAEQDGRRLGMVRIDVGLVSINVAPAERGNGYGTAILRAAIDQTGGPLTAEIKADNPASIRLFERCGFRLAGEADGLLRFVRH